MVMTASVLTGVAGGLGTLAAFAMGYLVGRREIPRNRVSDAPFPVRHRGVAPQLAHQPSLDGSPRYWVSPDGGKPVYQGEDSDAAYAIWLELDSQPARYPNREFWDGQVRRFPPQTAEQP